MFLLDKIMSSVPTIPLHQTLFCQSCFKLDNWISDLRFLFKFFRQTFRLDDDVKLFCSPIVSGFLGQIKVIQLKEKLAYLTLKQNLN